MPPRRSVRFSISCSLVWGLAWLLAAWSRTALATPPPGRSRAPLPTPIHAGKPPTRRAADPAARLPSPANAMLPVTWSAAGNDAAIHVGVATLRVTYANPGEARREGRRLAARLALIAAARRALLQISAAPFEGGAALFWQGRVVVALTPALARRMQSGPAQITAAWAAALHRAAVDPARPGTLPTRL
jgi:hypothetical protein